MGRVVSIRVENPSQAVPIDPKSLYDIHTVPAAKQDITDLTCCRAVFAAWVFVYHVDLYLGASSWLGPFAGLVRRGYLGVDGFFMLSGFILARMHPELSANAGWDGRSVTFSPPNFANALKFVTRRLARIYPVHLATILLLALVLLAGFAHGVTPRDPQRFGLPSLLQNLGLVQGWGFSTAGDWNYPSWSVSAEWAGYLLFPLFWWLISYFDVVVAVQIIIAAFMVLGLIAYVQHGSLDLYFAQGLIRFFPEFLIGIASARSVGYFADILPIPGCAAAGVVLAMLGAGTGFDLLAVFALWLTIFAFAMQADAQRPPLLGQRPVLHRFGLLSYAFYMSFAVAELIVSQIFREKSWTPQSHAWLFAAFMLGITLILAVLLHRLVETPCRRAVDRWLKPAASV